MTHEEERTIYELEEYTIDLQVPIVVENPTIVTAVDTEHFTVPTVEIIEHEHEVLHDKNFGLDYYEVRQQNLEGPQIIELDDGLRNCECLEDSGIPLNENGFVSWIDTQCTTHEYPADFGTGSCKAWDEGMAPFCDGPNPPAHCAKKWCFVSSACTAADLLDSTAFGVEDLHFSF